MGGEADYSKHPEEDLVPLIPGHGEHLDPKSVALIREEGTRVLANEAAAEALPDAEVMRNGQFTTVNGAKLEAVPA